MADILQFRPRPRPAPAGSINVRAEIEEAAQFALDTADRLIALLDGLDGEPDEELGSKGRDTDPRTIPNLR